MAALVEWVSPLVADITLFNLLAVPVAVVVDLRAVSNPEVKVYAASLMVALETVMQEASLLVVAVGLVLLVLLHQALRNLALVVMEQRTPLLVQR